MPARSPEYEKRERKSDPEPERAARASAGDNRPVRCGIETRVKAGCFLSARSGQSSEESCQFQNSLGRNEVPSGFRGAALVEIV